MPILELPVSIFGRRLRPMALGLAIWAVAVIWAAHDAADFGVDETIVTVVATVAVVLLTVAWVRRSQRVEEWGLLAIVFAALANGLHVLLTSGIGARSLVSLAICVMAAGSYWLERLLPRQGGTR